MNTKTTNIIMPALVSSLIGLVVYIYQDFKTENRANIKEIRNLIDVIQSNQIDSKLKDETFIFTLENHEKRLTKLEK